MYDEDEQELQSWGLLKQVQDSHVYQGSHHKLDGIIADSGNVFIPPSERDKHAKILVYSEKKVLLQALSDLDRHMFANL